MQQLIELTSEEDEPSRQTEPLMIFTRSFCLQCNFYSLGAGLLNLKISVQEFRGERGEGAYFVENAVYHSLMKNQLTLGSIKLGSGPTCEVHCSSLQCYNEHKALNSA